MGDVISYQGRVVIDGKPFDGTARFKFAIINAQGAQAWSSSEMLLNVKGGIYETRLGDSVQAPPIDGALLSDSNSPKLRIWIDRNGEGWNALGDDVALRKPPPLRRPVIQRLRRSTMAKAAPSSRSCAPSIRC